MQRRFALALLATTFPKGPARNAATAVFAAMTGIGSVMGLVVGGALLGRQAQLGSTQGLGQVAGAIKFANDSRWARGHENATWWNQ